jgi:hypothetical protein
VGMAYEIFKGYLDPAVPTDQLLNQHQEEMI